MAKSKTKIGKQIEKKTDVELVETVINAKKTNGWKKIADILSGPRKNFSNFNLDEISHEGKEEIIVIPGKVLSQGEYSGKARIVALKFSEKAKEKLLKSKIQTSSIVEEIKKNPTAKGIKILIK